MYTVNKYVSNTAPRETTHTGFTRSFAGMKYNINGGGRDTYIYNDNGGFNSMHGPRQ